MALGPGADPAANSAGGWPAKVSTAPVLTAGAAPVASLTTAGLAAVANSAVVGAVSSAALIAVSPARISEGAAMLAVAGPAKAGSPAVVPTAPAVPSSPMAGAVP